LVRKIANYLNGIDVSRHNVGDVLELPPPEADLLIAEGWAVVEHSERAAVDRRSGSDRRAQPQAAQPHAMGTEASPSTAEQPRQVPLDRDPRRAEDDQRQGEDRIRKEPDQQARGASTNPTRSGNR
jgi:hypothetical protein